MKRYAVLFASLLFVVSTLSHAAPLEELGDLSGAKWNNSGGKRKVLLYFWASWCTDCKSKLKGDLHAMTKKFQDLAVVTVNIDQDIERARHYVEKESVKLPVLRDDAKSFRKMLKVFSVPHWAVFERVNGDWNLVDTAPAFEWDRVSKAIKKGAVKHAY